MCLSKQIHLHLAPSGKYLAVTNEVFQMADKSRHGTEKLKIIRACTTLCLEVIATLFCRGPTNKYAILSLLQITISSLKNIGGEVTF